VEALADTLFEPAFRRVFVVGDPSATNARLVEAFGSLGAAAELVEPPLPPLGPGDLVLNRADVSPTFEGPAPSLWRVTGVEAAGAVLANRPTALYLAHDKLATASVLTQAHVPHPLTVHVCEPSAEVQLEPPYVVKPRFGSWGREVVLCEDRHALRRTLAAAALHEWFRQGGALVQERVGSDRADLRIVVAAGEVVGAVRRAAAPGEWRTNVSVGAVRQRVVPDEAACELAVRAVHCLGLELAGVDLMHDATGDHSVIEVNGAVDFTPDYSLPGRHVFADVAARLLAPTVAPVLVPV